MFLFAINLIFLKIKFLKKLQKIMIEEFIGGREIQVAIMGSIKN